jgi:hypothetical protein
MAKEPILGAALKEFIDSLEDSNDDTASQEANESRYFEIIWSYANPEVIASATTKQVVEGVYALADFLRSDIPNKYEDLLASGLDSFYLVPDENGDGEYGIWEAFEIVGDDKFPASEIDTLINKQKSQDFFELGYVSPLWLQKKVLKRQQYFDLWEIEASQEFVEGFHEGLVQNPMTPKKLLLEASETSYYEIRKKISKNPKADEEILKNILIRGDYEKPDYKEDRIDPKLIEAYERFMSSSSLIKSQYGHSIENHVIAWFRGVEIIMPTEPDLFGFLSSILQDGGSLKIEKFLIPAIRDNRFLEITITGERIGVVATNVARKNAPGRVQEGRWNAEISQPNTVEAVLKYWLADSPEINNLVQWRV